MSACRASGVLVIFFGPNRNYPFHSGSSRAVGIVATLAALAFAGSCSNYPTGPSSPVGTTAGSTTTTTVASTTTTTAGSTTTTVVGATTTTTTSTTTTLAAVDYATQVHPLWGSCTGCHDSGHPTLSLAGSPTQTCDAIAARDGSNGDLVVTGSGADRSTLIRKPALLTSHAGGQIGCFSEGSACWNTTLAWLTSGAPGPGGGTCGS